MDEPLLGLLSRTKRCFIESSRGGNAKTPKSSNSTTPCSILISSVDRHDDAFTFQGAKELHEHLPFPMGDFLHVFPGKNTPLLFRSSKSVEKIQADYAWSCTSLRRRKYHYFSGIIIEED